MNVFIYGLYDDRDPKTIYAVGKTIRHLSIRLRQYISKTKRDNNAGLRLSPIHSWINDLLLENRQPNIVLLETCSLKNWVSRERRLITFWKNINPNLKNSNIGGAGASFGTYSKICRCGRNKEYYPSGLLRCKFCAHLYAMRPEVKRKQRELNLSEDHKKKNLLYMRQYSRRPEIILKEQKRHHSRYHAGRTVRFLKTCRFCTKENSDVE